MDTGNKTLLQLSEEGKEARYVTLDVGAKISGYTKDYLERLCRLQKVTFLERHIGEYVIELESLLKETHTILLSYEGLTFVDKSDLHTPSETALEQDADIKEESSTNVKRTQYSTQIPNFAQNGNNEPEANEDMFSFTGRAIVSDAHHPEENTAKEKMIPTAAPVLQKEEKILAPITANVSPQAVVLPQKKPEVIQSLRPLHNVVHVPIEGGRAPDEWEKRLFGTHELSAPGDVSAETRNTNPSPYHPIVTSRDARDHHEDLPLFPLLIPKAETILLPPADIKSDQLLVAATVPAHEANAETTAISDSGQTMQEKGTTSAQLFDDVPKVTPKQIPLTATGAPLFGATSQRVTSMAPASSLPLMPPPQLPMMNEEHHLASKIPASLLTKSLGFNIAFIALLVFSASLFLSGSDVTRRSNFSGFINTQMAAVGEAFGNTAKNTKATEYFVPDSSGQEFKEPIEKHEFSDEVVITEGDEFGTILVQPVFKDGAGSVVEYTITSPSGE